MPGPRARVYSRGNWPASERSAPGDQTGELRLQFGSCTIPARPRIKASAKSCGASCAIALNDCQPLGMRGHVLELAAKPQFDVVTLFSTRLAAPPANRRDASPSRASHRDSGSLPEWQAGDFAVALHAHQADCIGANRAYCEPRLQSSATRTRLAFGEGGTPAPISSRRSAFSRTTTRNPRAASASEAVNSLLIRRWCARPPPLGQAALSYAFGGRAWVISGEAKKASRGQMISLSLPRSRKTCGVIERRIGAHAHKLREPISITATPALSRKCGTTWSDICIHLAWQWSGNHQHARSSIECCGAPYWPIQLIPSALIGSFAHANSHNLVVTEKPFFRRAYPFFVGAVVS